MFQNNKHKRAGYVLVEALVALFAVVVIVQHAVGHFVIIQRQKNERDQQHRAWEQAMMVMRQIAANQQPSQANSDFAITWTKGQLTVSGKGVYVTIEAQTTP